MFYQQRTDYCLKDHIGAAGVDTKELQALVEQLAPTFKQLAARESAAAACVLESATRTHDLAGIEALAANIRKRFTRVIVAGAGGSGLSGRTLIESRRTETSVAFDFLENIDPDIMERTLEGLDVKRTCFLIISKSGATVETLSQFYVLLEHAAKTLDKNALRDHFYVITSAGDSPLRNAASSYGLQLLDHDGDIGGRFSIFTQVGLLPAAIAGMDIAAVREGACSVIAAMDKATDASQCAPLMGAALQYAFMGKGCSISILFPYSDRLAAFGLWWRQCWAESLGKNGKGTTPIRAIGSTDQHSQLQLYLQGPKDKLITLITLPRAGSGARIPATANVEWLRGKTLGDVMEAEQNAILETLARHHCPVRLLTLTQLDEREMGALLMHFMLEIMFMAALLGVNPFDQPAVEEGKALAIKLLHSGIA